MNAAKLLLCTVIFGALAVGLAGCQGNDVGLAGYSPGEGGAARPWTDKSFRNDPRCFQFAIVADRNGGCRPGVFAQATEKLNLLQPEFVMSVGDCIPGYSNDPQEIAKQWAEFSALTGRLQMRFHHVPGNHDVGTEAMDAAWKQRFGPRYYAFTYGDVLFVCLNSQDDPADQAGLSQAQIAWARKTLADHGNARWTFVFMHKPLWETGRLATGDPERSKLTGFAEVEKALAGRDYTVFAGHWHTYTRFQRHRRRYFVLATTGGYSDLKGLDQGSFDHVVWVTMTPAGPRIANLLLDGIHGDDVYTEEHSLLARSCALQQVEHTASPFRLVLELTAKNPLKDPVQASVAWEAPLGSGWAVAPAQAQFSIEPGKEAARRFTVTYTGEAAAMAPVPVAAVSLKPPGLRAARLRLALPDAPVAQAIRRVCMGPECPLVAAAPKCDGKLDEPIWRRRPNVKRTFVASLDRLPSAQTHAWLAYDEQNLYLAVRCFEPALHKLVTHTKQHDGPCWDDDSVELFVDANGDRRSYHQFILTAAGVAYEGAGQDGRWNGAWQRAVGREAGAWTAELAVPWKTLGVAPPAVGSKINVQVARNRPHAGEETRWPPFAGSNHQPKLFGELTLGGK